MSLAAVLQQIAKSGNKEVHDKDITEVCKLVEGGQNANTTALHGLLLYCMHQRLYFLSS